jgi:hypothetical protein
MLWKNSAFSTHFFTMWRRPNASVEASHNLWLQDASRHSSRSGNNAPTPSRDFGTPERSGKGYPPVGAALQQRGDPAGDKGPADAQLNC